jgi:hypothetical protein
MFMSGKAYFRLNRDGNRQIFGTGLWKILKQLTNSHFIHRNNGMAYSFQLQITGPYFFDKKHGEEFTDNLEYSCGLRRHWVI